MAKLMDLWAETGADIIDDDANPTLKITNDSTAGTGLETNRLVASSAATIVKLTVPAAILAANATITAFNLRGPSCASGALMAFTGKALVSCTTILFTTGGVAGTKAVRIVDELGTFGWIPVLPDAAVTGAVI